MLAYIRPAGQMATWGDEHEGPRGLTFDEARRLHPWLSAKAQGGVGKNGGRSGGTILQDVVAPEREAVREWNQRGLLGRGDGCVGLSSTSVSLPLS